ncbi:hypothetical protein NIES2101_38110 [Calothrix sp. HK-06]|nr:hypothetical protein NIES2101_38110 [Calothrix sp. HK-06]
MTRFNPQGGFKDITLWESIAEKKAGKTGAASRIIAGILLGSLGLSMGAAPLGGVVAAWFLKSAWDALEVAGKRLKVVRDMGCNAFVLEESNFRIYVQQFGDEAVYEELIYAEAQGCELSNFSANWLQAYTKGLNAVQEVKPLGRETNKTAVATALAPGTETFNPSIKDRIVNIFNPKDNEYIDIIKEITDRIRTLLIVGVSGSGKGIIVSNAIREAKRKHPNLKVVVIDPKDDEKEIRYWKGIADEFISYPCMDAKPSTVVEWADYAFKQYQDYANQNEQTLAVIDEGTLLGLKANLAKSTLIKDKITAYSSAGDSSGRFVWFLVQSPFVGASSLDLSTSTQMTTIAIHWEENLGALSQWKGSKILRKLSLDTVGELVDKSPVGRAIYYGKTDKWYSLQELTNHSGYNRDKREYLPGFEPKSSNITKLENSLKSEPEPKDASPKDSELGGFDLNKALDVLRTFKGKDWVKFGDARANCKPLRKVTRDADDVRLVVNLLKKDGEAETKEDDLFRII